MPDLDTFLKQYADDDNAWWRLETGEMQALFDALIERCTKAEAEIDRLRALAARLGKQIR